MSVPVPQALDRLCALTSSGIPVLRVTAAELKRMEAVAERVSSNELATAILRDPLMTLRVLSFLYGHRTRSQTHDITTIAHALMMLGLERFFREFSDLPTIDDVLASDPEALGGVYQAASRARLASMFARDWAVQRHDTDPEEVMVAALVHDVTVPLVACAWPAGPPALAGEEHGQLRSA